MPLVCVLHNYKFAFPVRFGRIFTIRTFTLSHSVASSNLENTFKPSFPEKQTIHRFFTRVTVRCEIRTNFIFRRLDGDCELAQKRPTNCFRNFLSRGSKREQLERRSWIGAAKHKWTSEALNHHLWLNFLASSLDETKQRLINIFLFFLIFTLNIIDNNSNRSNKTFKPKKNIPEGTHQYDLMKHAAATLGSGNLRNAVQLPEGEDVNEWIAVNSELNDNSRRWFSCWWFHF